MAFSFDDYYDHKTKTRHYSTAMGTYALPDDFSRAQQAMSLATLQAAINKLSTLSAPPQMKIDQFKQFHWALDPGFGSVLKGPNLPSATKKKPDVSARKTFWNRYRLLGCDRSLLTKFYGQQPS